MSTTENDPRGLGLIITEAIADFQKLVRQQIDLTVAELKDSTKAALRSSVLVITAVTLFLVSALMIVVALGFGLAALGLPYWAAFLLDAGLFILAALVLLVIAKNQAAKVKMPTAAMDNIETSVNEVTESVTRSKLIK